MDIKRVQEIVATLPLSYYFGEKADYKLTVREDTETSHCCLSTHEIVISMKNIENAEKNMKTEATESVVRGLVYHELSHAILTNPVLVNAYQFYCEENGGNRNPAYEFNVIEDERIETIFSKFYLGVDFWKNRLAVLGPCKTPAETREDYLFNVTRYHETEGHPEALEALKLYLTSACTKNSAYGACMYAAKLGFDAVSKIFDIFGKIEEERKAQQQNKDEKEGKSKSEKKNTEESKEEKENEEKENKEEKSKNGKENAEKSKEGKESKKADEKENKGNQPDNNKASIFTEQEQETINNNIRKAVIKEAEDDYKKYYGKTLNQLKADFSLTSSLLKIIARNGGFGVSDELSTEGYTGDFDPELKMTDFSGERKWWSDSDDYGNTSKTASEKVLNIWLDNSSSFEHNDRAVNKILASLAEIEKKMKSFKFRLVRITTEWKELKGNQRISNSRGNNYIPENVKDTYARLNPTGEEKNIVLFDGQAGYPEDFARLKCFDNRNTTFIVEEDNTEYIKENCRNSIIIEENTDYAGTLLKNVEKAFDQLF